MIFLSNNVSLYTFICHKLVKHRISLPQTNSHFLKVKTTTLVHQTKQAQFYSTTCSKHVPKHYLFFPLSFPVMLAIKKHTKSNSPNSIIASVHPTPLKPLTPTMEPPFMVYKHRNDQSSHQGIKGREQKEPSTFASNKTT